jgi:predicted  nucleic acid-binding Zn ribbon protein
VNKKQLLQSFQDLKKEIEILRKKHLVQGLVDKFYAEKKVLERRIEKTVVDEMKKAKKFMNEQKKELDKIQKKVEAAISKRQSASKKKVAKKATKKVAKVVKSTAKKATKKVSKK